MNDILSIRIVSAKQANRTVFPVMVMVELFGIFAFCEAPPKHLVVRYFVRVIRKREREVLQNMMSRLFGRLKIEKIPHQTKIHAEPSINVFSFGINVTNLHLCRQSLAGLRVQPV